MDSSEVYLSHEEIRDYLKLRVISNHSFERERLIVGPVGCTATDLPQQRNLCQVGISGNKTAFLAIKAVTKQTGFGGNWCFY